MLKLITTGGPIIYILIIFYLIAFSIIIERSIFFFVTRCNADKYRHEFFNRMNTFTNKEIEKKYKAGKLLPGYYYSPISRIVFIYFENRKAPISLRNDLIAVEGNKEISKMEKHLWGLNTIGHIAPLLGILGTVTGLMRSFQQMQVFAGNADISFMAGGIWEAMLTTALGLTIAIPSLIAAKYYENVVDQRTEEMQYTLTKLRNYFENNKKT